MPSPRGPGARSEYFARLLQGVADTFGIPTSVPWKKLKKQDQKLVLYGSGSSQVHLHYKNRYGRTRSYYTNYEGVVTYLQRRHGEAESDSMREQIEGYMREVPCSECGGARLKPKPRGDDRVAGASSRYATCRSAMRRDSWPL